MRRPEIGISDSTESHAFFMFAKSGDAIGTNSTHVMKQHNEWRFIFRSLLVILGISLTTALSAQDIIIKKNAEEIKAKILEIGESNVTYKKFSNPNGPSYTIPKSHIFMIKYQNGEKETFNDMSSPNEPQKQESLEEQRRQKRLEQQHLLYEKKEQEHRKRMGKHNIKVTFNGGLASTPIKLSDSKDEYDFTGLFGGGIDFNIMYNLSIADYTGDVGIGLGLTRMGSGDLKDTFGVIDWLSVNYFTIPIEMTYRARKGYFGVALNNAIAIGCKGKLDGETIISSLDDAKSIHKYRFGMSFKGGFTISKFDIGLYYTWWMTDMFSFDNLKPISVSTPSHQFGINLAYRLKIK